MSLLFAGASGTDTFQQIREVIMNQAGYFVRLVDLAIIASAVVTVCTDAPSCAQQTTAAIEGHYAGKAQGTPKLGVQCFEMSVEILVIHGSVTGTTKQPSISPKSNFTTLSGTVSGAVSADGTAELTLFGRTFPAKIGGGRLTGRYIGLHCDYEFNIPRSP